MYGKEFVSKKAILRYITSYDIFKKYVSNFTEVGKKFTSELRNDKTPTCCIACIGDDLRYRDFSETKSIDCFDYVQRKYNVTFTEALHMIALDFNLPLAATRTLNYVPTPSVVHNVDISTFEKLPTTIEIVVRPWTVFDKRFWNSRYDITVADLQRFQVYPIKGFWLNNAYIVADTVAYAYYNGVDSTGRKLFKIYQPFNKGMKWISNCSQDALQGEDQLPWTGELLIITKSLKDVIVLTKAGYNSIAPHSENMGIPRDKMALLQRRFSKIVILFDNDPPGLLAAQKLGEEYSIPHYAYPEAFAVKDSADFVEKYGYDNLQQHLDTVFV